MIYSARLRPSDAAKRICERGRVAGQQLNGKDEMRGQDHHLITTTQAMRIDCLGLLSAGQASHRIICTDLVCIHHHITSPPSPRYIWPGSTMPETVAATVKEIVYLYIYSFDESASRIAVVGE